MRVFREADQQAHRMFPCFSYGIEKERLPTQTQERFGQLEICHTNLRTAIGVFQAILIFILKSLDF